MYGLLCPESADRHPRKILLAHSHTDHLFVERKDAKLFSTLDMHQANNQVRLREENIPMKSIEFDVTSMVPA